MVVVLFWVGLINRKSIDNSYQSSSSWVIFLLLGYLFKQEGMSEKVEELVIIIEPHIVKKDGSNIGLQIWDIVV